MQSCTLLLASAHLVNLLLEEPELLIPGNSTTKQTLLNWPEKVNTLGVS